MGRFKENDLPKAKITASSINKAKIIFKYAGKNTWKFYLGLLFLLLTSVTALAFPKFMGMLVDCVNKKDSGLANQIALGLGLVLILQSVFSFFRLSLFVNFTENTLANLRLALYSNLVKLPMSFFSQKRVGELNSRISSDITQIQTALDKYALNRTDGLYPVTSSANIQGLCLDNTGFVPACGGIVFMEKIPSNPTPSGTDYIYNSDGMSYTLTYWLEGKTGSFPAGAATATPGGMQ